MRYRVAIAPAASQDEEDILTYLVACEELPAAKVLAARFDRALASLASFPGRGRIVPELRRHGIVAFREIIVAPHRIVYRIAGKVVRVVAIVDGRRDLDDLLRARVHRNP